MLTDGTTDSKLTYIDNGAVYKLTFFGRHKTVLGPIKATVVNRCSNLINRQKKQIRVTNYN